jgi:L,D-transpeptidase catalytic domain/Putative peptidoglycan binding domain
MARRRPLALLSLALVLLLAATTATAGAQQPRRIRAGMSTAGIDLSGLTVTEAAARIETTLGPRLQGDFVLGAAGRPWALKMSDAKLSLDAVRTAKRALYAKAGVTAVQPAISHSRVAVRQFVNHVAGQVRRAPRDAAIRITVKHIFRSRARSGKALPVSATRAGIDAALDDPAAPRRLHQRLVRVSPKVHYGELSQVYGTVVTIDRDTFTLRLFKRLKFAKRYRIAVGMAGVSTPPGRYAIQNKAIDPAWHVPNSAWAGSLAGSVVPGGAPNNPLKARWMGIANGVGIHGTAESWSIGTRASHGCIRMHVADVKDLYPRVPVGTAVLIK